MALSARERIREIALLRTLGFSRVMILMLTLGESLMLSLFGGLLGLGLFVLGFKPLKASLINTPLSGFATAMTLFPEILLLGLLITIFVGLFSGLVPAIQASQRPITEGLRHIG